MPTDIRFRKFLYWTRPPCTWPEKGKGGSEGAGIPQGQGPAQWPGDARCGMEVSHTAAQASASANTGLTK